MWLFKILCMCSVAQVYVVSIPFESGPQWPPEATYEKTVLKHHNVHRKNHSAKALTWSQSLKESAMVLADRCVFGHNTTIHGGGYGQNLAAGIQHSHVSEAITVLFYNQEMPLFKGQYGLANPSGFYSWGHFSQVVWKGTKRVACVTKNCTAEGGLRDPGSHKVLPYPPYLTVCNYSPPGNYEGEYGTNIGRPLGMQTVGAQY